MTTDSPTTGRSLPAVGDFRFNNSRLTRWGLSVLGVTIFLLFWQGTTMVLGLDSQYFPSPVDVYEILVTIWPVILDALPNTLLAAGVGFLISLVLTISLAMVLVTNERILEALMPFIIGINTVPRIALTPLVIYWIGFIGGVPLVVSNYVMAVWVAFFPMLIAAIDGFRNIDERTENMLDLYGATAWQEFKHVRFVKGLPFIFDGMKSGFILAMIGAVVGEFISGTFGIGSMASSVIGQLSIGRAVAIVLILGAISAAVIFVIYLIESRVIFWRDSSIMGEG
jgi:NitT/TauT family transport system permease protein